MSRIIHEDPLRGLYSEEMVGELLDEAVPLPDWGSSEVRTATPELLNARATLTCLRYCASLTVMKAVWEEESNSQRIDDGDLANVLSEALIMETHALGQAGPEPSPDADDIGWIEQLKPIFANVRSVYRRARDCRPIMELEPSNLVPQTWVWNTQVMYQQRTIEGDPVYSPYGPEYAARVAFHDIILPGRSPLKPEYANRADAIIRADQPGLLESMGLEVAI